jgi:hypothetical protein
MMSTARGGKVACRSDGASNEQHTPSTITDIGAAAGPARRGGRGGSGRAVPHHQPRGSQGQGSAARRGSGQTSTSTSTARRRRSGSGLWFRQRRSPGALEPGGRPGEGGGGGQRQSRGVIEVQLTKACAQSGDRRGAWRPAWRPAPRPQPQPQPQRRPARRPQWRPARRPQ